MTAMMPDVILSGSMVCDKPDEVLGTWLSLSRWTIDLWRNSGVRRYCRLVDGIDVEENIIFS